jgi:nucleoid DNA-binding protein
MINQKELCVKIRANTNFKYSIQQIEEIVSCLTETIVDVVASGEDVYLKNFAKVYPKYVKGKTITNAGIPWLNGKQYKVENRFKLGFSPNKAASKKIEALLSTLKDYAVNDKPNTNKNTTG